MRRRLCVLIVALASAAAPSAAETETMRFSDAFLARGEARGIRLAPQGVISRGPEFEVFRSQGKDVPRLALWGVVRGPDRLLYAVGGTPGGLFREGANGQLEIFAQIDDPLATAAVALTDGTWIVAGAPSGTLWKVAADGSTDRWGDTDARYVWKLAVDAKGLVWAATGDPARLLSLDADGEARRVFEPDETHLTVLQPASADEWWVGGAGRGRLYRVHRDGQAEVIYDDELDEVVSLTVVEDDWILALTRHLPVGERAPRIRIRLPTGQDGTTTLPGVGKEGEPTLEGTLESDGPPPVVDTAPRGRVVRLNPRGTVDELWSSNTQAPFTLASSGARLWMGIGEPATLLEYGPGGWIRVATWAESMITSLLYDDTLALTTARPAALRLSVARNETGGSFVSPAADAGTNVRWGRMRWLEEGSVHGVEFSTRTGNSPNPDTTWSRWSPPLTDPSGSPILSEGSRYMQWRVRWNAAVTAGGSLYQVEASYVPRNRAPEFTSFTADKPDPDKASVEVRWEVLDPDRDPLRVSLESRRVPDGEWTREAVTSSEPGPPGKTRARRSGRFDWSTGERAEGKWQIRGRVEDQPGNPAGTGREHFTEVQWLVLDRTPPTIRWERAGNVWQAVVEDGNSPVIRFRALKNGEPQYSLSPLDGVPDGLREIFRLRSETPVDSDWTFRAVDASGNVQEVAGPTS